MTRTDAIEKAQEVIAQCAERDLPLTQASMSLVLHLLNTGTDDGFVPIVQQRYLH